MYTDREKKDRGRKDEVEFPMGVGEATNPEKMEALYDSIRTCGTEE